MEKEIQYLVEIVNARYNPIPKGCGDENNSSEMDTIFCKITYNKDTQNPWEAIIAIGKPDTCAWLNYRGTGVTMEEAIERLSRVVIDICPEANELG